MEYLIAQTSAAMALSLLIGYAMGWLIRGIGVRSRTNIMTSDLNSAQRSSMKASERVDELTAELKACQTATKEKAVEVIAKPKASKPAPAKTKKATKESTEEKSADDLKKIKGIGPALEKKLHAIGVTSYKQIASFTTKDIEDINSQLNFKGRIEREEWIKQAKEF